VVAERYAHAKKQITQSVEEIDASAPKRKRGEDSIVKRMTSHHASRRSDRRCYSGMTPQLKASGVSYQKVGERESGQDSATGDKDNWLKQLIKDWVDDAKKSINNAQEVANKSHPNPTSRFRKPSTG
jgi:hypothetical protein